MNNTTIEYTRPRDSYINRLDLGTREMLREVQAIPLPNFDMDNASSSEKSSRGFKLSGPPSARIDTSLVIYLHNTSGVQERLARLSVAKREATAQEHPVYKVRQDKRAVSGLDEYMAAMTEQKIVRAVKLDHDVPGASTGGTFAAAGHARSKGSN